MKRFNTLISFIFTKAFYNKAIAYAILILLLIFFRGFAVIFFLTFIFAYLFYSSANFIKIKLDTFLVTKFKKSKFAKYLKKYLSLNFIIVLQYLIFILVFASIISSAIPKLQTELTGLSNTIPIIGDELNNVKEVLSDINNDYTQIGTTIKEAFTSSDYNILIDVFNKLKDAGIILLKFIFSLVLSFVFLLDRKKLKKYLGGVKNSNFSFLYYEYKIIFEKIIKSFGLIIKAQSMIALANAILTVIGLFALGTIFMDGVGFPYLLTLGLVVFVFGFVPIVGVFLSSIPILIVGFSTTGSISVVFAIIALIILIHSIEAYYLNPRIVSNFLELPVSLTFVILFIGENLFGIAGLLIGVSLFYFMMGLFKDIDIAISRKHKAKKIENKILNRAKKTAN